MLLLSHEPPGAPGQSIGPGEAPSTPPSSAAPSFVDASPVAPPSEPPPSPPPTNEGEPHAVRTTTAPASARKESAMVLKIPQNL